MRLHRARPETVRQRSVKDYMITCYSKPGVCPMKATRRLGFVPPLLLLCSMFSSAVGQDLAAVRVLEVRPAAAGAFHVFASVQDNEGRRVDGLGAANFSGMIGPERIQA